MRKGDIEGAEKKGIEEERELERSQKKEIERERKTRKESRLNGKTVFRIRMDPIIGLFRKSSPKSLQKSRGFQMFNKSRF